MRLGPAIRAQIARNAVFLALDRIAASLIRVNERKAISLDGVANRNIASLGIASTWSFIVICQMMLRRTIKRGEAADIDFRMPFAPFTSWLTLAFLFSVLVLMGFDYPDGTYTIAAIPVVAILLGVGWLVLKGSSPFSPTIPSYVLTHVVELDKRNDER